MPPDLAQQPGGAARDPAADGVEHAADTQPTAEPTAEPTALDTPPTVEHATPSAPPAGVHTADGIVTAAVEDVDDRGRTTRALLRQRREACGGALSARPDRRRRRS